VGTRALTTLALAALVAGCGVDEDARVDWSGWRAIPDGGAAPGSPEPRPCAAGEQRFGAHCYVVATATTLSYQSGKAFCEARGTALASIDSPEENAFVLGLLPKAAQKAWIGLRRAAPGAPDFVWESGAAPGYLRWAAGEPNNDGGKEDCGQLWGPAIPKASLAGFWNDAPCGDTGSAVCKRAP
jgi:hypothetical protein